MEKNQRFCGTAGNVRMVSTDYNGDKCNNPDQKRQVSAKQHIAEHGRRGRFTMNIYRAPHALVLSQPSHTHTHALTRARRHRLETPNRKTCIGPLRTRLSCSRSLAIIKLALIFRLSHASRTSIHSPTTDPTAKTTTTMTILMT